MKTNDSTLAVNIKYHFLFLILIFQCSCFLAKCQQRKNEFNISAGLMYYPDWKFNSKVYGFNYVAHLKHPLFLEFGLNTTSRDLFLSGKLVPDTNDYGMTIDRTLNFFDSKLGYIFWNSTCNHINIAAFTGFSFVWGSEQELAYVRYGPPFNEVLFDAFTRHHPGVNLGSKVGIYFLTFMQAAVEVSGRVYTYGQPDLTISANIGFNFGGYTK